MNNGYQKMTGTASLQAIANTYQMETTTADTTINTQTSYDLKFSLADGLDTTGYIVIGVPT